MRRFLDRFFGKKRTPAVAEVETKPLSMEKIDEVEHPTFVTFKPAQLIVGTAQSVGMQRDHNEDTLFALNAILSDGEAQVPFGIFIIADGMGGHMHGEVASGVAARAMAEYLVKKLYSPLLGLSTQGLEDSLQEIMENGVYEAQAAVLRRAPGGGTTLTVALVIGELVTLAHVGDSRAYFIHPFNQAEIITQDHSLVHKLIQMGQITEEEAAVHPQKNILYRAIGQHEPFHPDIKNIPFPRPGYLMLCSDGLWGVVNEPEIIRRINKASSLPEACSSLVEAANAAGGPDNISVILVQYLE